VTLRDRVSGLLDPLGAPAGCGIAAADGRAVVRVSDPPFSFPALEIEGDTVAFLEPESESNRCDETNDDDSSDDVLRIFRLGVGETVVTPLRAVDPAPKLDGRSLRLSEGHVFVRTSEAAMARRKTERVPLRPDGNGTADGYSTQSAITPDSRF